MSRRGKMQNKGILDALARSGRWGSPDISGGAIFEIVLEGLPPTVNHLYRTARDGTRYKTKAGRRWQQETASIMRLAWMRPPYEGDVELRLAFQTADRRRWDIDNRVKAVQDCLQLGGVLKDDRQVLRLFVGRDFGVVTETRLELLAI